MRPPFSFPRSRPPRIRPRGDDAMYAEVQQVFRLADEAAQADGSGVTADHLALGVWRAAGTSGAHILRELGIDEASLRPPSGGAPFRRGWGLQIQPIIQAAGEEAWQMGSRLTRSGHVLLGLVATGQGVLPGLLAAKGLSLEALRERVRAAVSASPRAERGPSPTDATTTTTGQSLFTVEEAAAFLGIHHQTIRGYIKSGKLPAFRVAGEKIIRIKRDDLMALLEPVPVDEMIDDA